MQGGDEGLEKTAEMREGVLERVRPGQERPR
jgi:hypothetical protein